MNCCFYTVPKGVRSWLEMVDMAAEYQMDRLELFTNLEFTEPDLEFAKIFRAYAEEKGVSVCCLSTSADITGPDAGHQIQRMKGFAEMAALVGSPYLHHTICPEYRSIERVLANREELFTKGLAGVREIFDYARTLGVRTIYEDQGILFNGRESFGRLLAEVDRPVGVVADFGNIRQADEEIIDFIRAYYPRIVHVHLKDSIILPAAPGAPNYGYPTRSGKWMQEVEPGTGTVPLAEGIMLLKELGYQGTYSIEFAPTDPALRKKTVNLIAGWTETN